MTMVGVNGDYDIYMPDAEHKNRAKEQHWQPERTEEQSRMLFDRIEQFHVEEQQKAAAAQQAAAEAQQTAAEATERLEPYTRGRAFGAVGQLTSYLSSVCDDIGSRSFERVKRELARRARSGANEVEDVDHGDKVVNFRFTDKPVAFKTIQNRLSSIGKQKKNPGIR